MPISNSYPKGVPIEDADLFVGTKANNNRTVNYTAAGIADYLNINSRIAIGGQMSFQFVISPNIPGTISFEGGGGNNTPFSTITKLIVSAIDVSSSNITIFLNYLTNSDILLSQQNEPNYFGHYKITGYTQIDTTEFYQLDLSYIGGSGNIERDLYYDIVSFVITSGSSTTPSLDEVLTVGNTSTGKDIELTYDLIGGGGKFTAIDDTGLIQSTHSYDGFRTSSGSLFTEYLNGVIRLDGGSSTSTMLYFTAPTGVGTIIIPDVLNSTETFALLSDIPAAVTPTLDEVLAVGSVSSMVLTDGSTYDVNLPFDDGFDIYMGDIVTTADNNNQASRIMQYQAIINTINSEVAGVQLSNANLLSQLYPTSGDYNIIHQSFKIDGADAGAVQIQIPTPKTFSPNGQVNYKFPYKEVTGDYTLATLDDIPSTTTLVPYTGATQYVDLGLFDITAASLIKNGGVNTQFLKADGSVDNNIYLTSADLPSTLELFATTTVDPIIPGYTVLVRNITDPRYDIVAVNVPIGPITTQNMLVGSLISDNNIISGNPGLFDITTIGNIRRTSGTGQAEFYFRVYKRDVAGTETFITQSNVTLPVLNGGYAQFSAIALWNNGIFLDTDRVVIKFYASRIVTSPVGSDPSFEFQFGGITPVRSAAAVPVAVIPNIFLADLADVENVAPLNNETLYWNATSSLWEHTLLVTDAIVDGVTTVAPSQNAVFDALALNTSFLNEDFSFNNLINNTLGYFFPNQNAATFTNLMRTANITLSGNTAINTPITRIAFSTTATAGTLGFLRGAVLSIDSNSSTYFFSAFLKFDISSNVSGTRFFAGWSRMYGTTTPTNVEPDTMINSIGVCKLSTSENLHILHNDATGTATTVDLGVNYPANNVDGYVYILKLSKQIGSTDVLLELQRNSFDGSGITSSTSYVISTNLPALAVNPAIWICNNATATIASFESFGGVINKNSNY
jgi:hypothetical protein